MAFLCCQVALYFFFVSVVAFVIGLSQISSISLFEFQLLGEFH